MSLIPPTRPWKFWPVPVLWLHFQPGFSAARTRIAPVLVAPMVDSSRWVDAGDSNSPRFSRARASATECGAAPS